MRIDIQTTEINLGQNFKQMLKVKIRRLFQHNSQHIRLINITFRDINGPKGGEDKLCKVNIFASRGQHILVSVKDNSAFKAATLAIKKANNTLHRQLGKARAIKHTSLAQLAPETA
jgi:ribosome-associated translation inhibitor RaiA